MLLLPSRQHLQQRQQLKITIPIECDKNPHRGCGSDRPHPDRNNNKNNNNNIREVPALLREHIPLEDWIRFCDRWQRSCVTKKSGKKLWITTFFSAVVTIGVFVSRLENNLRWKWVLCVLGILLSTACGYLACVHKDKHKRQRNAACEGLSKKTGFRVCVYGQSVRRFDKVVPDGDYGETKQYQHYHYLVVWINPDGWGYHQTRKCPFLAPDSEVPKESVVILDDHIEGATTTNQPSWANSLARATTPTTSQPEPGPL